MNLLTVQFKATLYTIDNEPSCVKIWNALEVIPVDAAAELLSRAAQVDDARRSALLQLGQQQLCQEHRTKVIGPKCDLHSK